MKKKQEIDKNFQLYFTKNKPYILQRIDYINNRGFHFLFFKQRKKGWLAFNLLFILLHLKNLHLLQCLDPQCHPLDFLKA